MPTSQYQQLLTLFDLVGLNRYGITTDDLRDIERYIHILQSGLSETVWDEAVQIGVFLLEQSHVEEAKAYLEQLRQGGV